ncbi:phage holin family protein [Pseudomonas fluorescens]|uniref:phage holin family protein n=1 Tax=Pseudomonas fluorescens TaxID=294 RepID=UPI003D239183
MNTEHQALADVPLWLLVLLSMAGLSGEMLRASGSDLGIRQILQRVALRFLASGLLGMATLLLAMALWNNLYLAAGLGIVIAVIGADVAGGLYTQFLAKRAGVSDPSAGRNTSGQ